MFWGKLILTFISLKLVIIADSSVLDTVTRDYTEIVEPDDVIDSSLSSATIGPVGYGHSHASPAETSDSSSEEESHNDASTTVAPSDLPSPESETGENNAVEENTGDAEQSTPAEETKAESEQVEETTTEGSQTTEEVTPEIPAQKNKQHETLEKATGDIIEKTVKTYKLNFLRYKTQLNLNALESIIPVFEAIKGNMTLLNNSTMDLEAFTTKSETLETDMIAAEDRFVKNRALIRESTTLQDNIHSQLQSVHQSMTNILKSQLDMFHPPGQHEALVARAELTAE